jgi:poly(3-hydroxybutyrate) depolymerase
MTLRERVRRFREWLRQLLRRRPPEGREGYFEAGGKWSWRGWLTQFPWVAPSRDYLVYLPRDYVARRSYPLVVWLHGCKQSPEEFAAGSGIAGEADGHPAIVLLPRQASHANPEGCWNWFDPGTAAGYGEAAIVMAQIHDVSKRYRIDRRRIFVAGMSSGGALAAVLAVAIHSGVPCGAATNAWSAAEALRSGPNRQVERIALAARHHARAGALPLPALVIQGAGDDRVHAANARRLATQFLALNGDDRAFSSDSELPPADRVDRLAGGDNLRSCETHCYTRDGQDLVRYALIDGLGHAWSGGDPAYPWHDAQGPSATRLIFAFFDQRMKARRMRSFLSRLLGRSEAGR